MTGTWTNRSLTKKLFGFVVMSTFVSYILYYTVMKRQGGIMFISRQSSSRDIGDSTSESSQSSDLDMRLALWGLPLEKPPSYRSDLKNPCWFNQTSSGGDLYCLPYFYLLGVTKCGTTTLFNNLVQHPQIGPRFEKEMNFWMNPRERAGFFDYAKKVATPSHTGSQIEITSDSKRFIKCDASPNYFSDQGNLSKISDNWDSLRQEPIYTLAHTLYALNPKTKLLVLMRNPTDRLFSHYYMHMRQTGTFSAQDFHNRVNSILKVMTHCLSTRTERSCAFDPMLHRMTFKTTFLQYSMYYPYAVEWLSVFPRYQMKFVKSEDWYQNPTEVISEIFDFLEVPDPGQDVYDIIETNMRKYTIINHISHNSSLTVENARSYHDAMFPETRLMLNEFFKPLNVKLAELLGDDSFLFI